MAALTHIAITHGEENSQSVVNDSVEAASLPHEALQKLINLFQGLLGGTRHGRVEHMVEDATVGNKATATVTITDASLVDDTDTLSIGPTVLEWFDAPSGESQIDIGGSDAQSATNLAAVINAHSTLAGVMTATAAAGVVTITADRPGLWAELITLAEVGDGQVLSAAALGGVTSTVKADTRSYGFGVA